MYEVSWNVLQQWIKHREAKGDVAINISDILATMGTIITFQREQVKKYQFLMRSKLNA